MNLLVKAIVLSFSTALVAAPALAAAQDPHNPSHQVQNHLKTPVRQPHNTVHKKAFNPSHDWRAGQKNPFSTLAKALKSTTKSLKN